MRLLSVTTVTLMVVAAFAVGRVTAPAPVAAMPLAKAFSHFECYQAQFQGSFPTTTVQLTDQFQTYETTVGAPQLFCTPVTKKVIKGVRGNAPAPADHLTCYAIQGPEIQQTRPYANQFIKGEVSVGVPTLLCAPTNKTG